MKFNVFFLLLAISLCVIQCGGASTPDSNEEGSGSGDGGSDSGGDSETGFQVAGQLATLTVSGLMKGAGETSSGTVTDIIAVNPVTSDVSCKVVSVEDDNSFSFKIKKRRPWFFFFIDREQIGSDMFMGRFKSRDDNLDTLNADSDDGSTDLGTVTIDAASQTATSDKDDSELITDLGLDDTLADTLGEVDDIARRYSNPDVDNDGQVDCEETDADYRLDFHVRFDMYVSSSTKAKMTDIIDSFLSSSLTTAKYTGTGVYVSYPSSFSSKDSGSFTFVDSTVTTSEGGSIATNKESSAVTTNNYGNYNGFGPNTTSTSELPSGKIIFTFGSQSLTFTNVQTPSLTEITAPTGRIFPFIKFNKTSSSCSSACTLSSIDYKWMKKTVSGWEEASLEEVDFLVAEGGGTISFRVDNNSSKTVSFAIPKTSISGSLIWDSSTASLSGVTVSELTALTTSQICHLGLSHDDQLGMRYFQGIDNASGTCSS